MTITVYTCTFCDAAPEERRTHATASVWWDKHHPKMLRATLFVTRRGVLRLCERIWDGYRASNSVKSETALRAALDKAATREGMYRVAEGWTPWSKHKGAKCATTMESR